MKSCSLSLSTMDGGCWSKHFFLWGIFFNFCIGQGTSIYFTQSEVSLTRTFIPDSGLLYVVKATGNRNEDGLIQYSISKPVDVGISESSSKGGKGGKNTTSSSSTKRCIELVIDENLGNISMSLPNEVDKNVREGNSLCVYKVVAKLLGKSVRESSSSENDNKAEMTIKLNASFPLSVVSQNDNCESLSKKELCFGGADHLELRVMENAPVIPVAYLGSLPGLCANFRVSYNVSNSQGSLSATKAVTSYEPISNIIQTTANLDRERVEVYSMSVNCILEPSQDPNKIEVIQINGRLLVLDENDNVMVTQEDASSNVTVYISFSDHDYKIKPGKRLHTKEDSELLTIDDDTLGVNNFKVYSVNDTKGLFVFDLIEFPYVLNGTSASAANLKIALSDSAKDLQPWDGYYCVLAIVNDTTVIASKRGQDFRYTICVSWGQDTTSLKPSERPSHTDLLNRLSRQDVETHLARSAQKFAPVLYPFPDLIEDWSELVPDLEFTLTHLSATVEDMTYIDTNNNKEDELVMTTTEYDVSIFEVTPKMAVIYLAHPETLRNSSFQSFHLQLHCNSSLIPPFVTNITIFLDSPLSNETLCDMELCSEHADSKSCEMSCGYGSPGKCMWRHEQGFNNSIGMQDDDLSSSNAPRYPTCSPYLKTCPDSKCDEMEQMFPHLCPQDCATEYRGFGKLQKHVNGKSYGIDGNFCKGVGTCHDPNTCSCAHLPPPVVDSSTSYEHRKTGGGKLAFSTPNSECGSQCVITLLAVGLIAGAFIGLSLYVWKARVERQRKSRSLNQSVRMTENHNIEMPYGENTGNGTLISDADYIAGRLGNHHHTTMMMVSDDQFAQHQIIQVDSKWEIPRDDLLLEHILGEGQFGRVLKGRLHGQNGGYMPVAVKMLKVDAAQGSKSLWQEFMAEFSLLKQVDHPNVIKLLGACTTTGGTPYLVMEYAEYGALRSFLRKCRRVEKINGSHGALHHWDNGDLSSSPVNCSTDPLDLDYIVTPREVLGFSWQIAKGMAYLSDMKMVHRDLAARNILLTKLKVCKISDFGLTRDIYVDDAYQKKSKDRVPVKWLAPECLADELYTTKSDVWAFGILVWELTTLGASPYPGIQTEQLYSLLNAGYRMPQPQNCSNELYSLMRRCWAYQPSNRPTFHQIVLELSKMLEDGIEYLKLDVPSVSNPGYDYFSQSERAGSEMVNLSPLTSSPITGFSEGRPIGRRKLSMENLRLIDYEISTDDEFLTKRNSSSNHPLHHLPPHKSSSCTTHTYINEPPKKPSEQDCSNVPNQPASQVVSSSSTSSGYESPIRSATSVAV